MIFAILLATLFNTVSSTSTPCSGTVYSVPFPYQANGSTPNLAVAAGGVTLTYPSGWTINKISSTSTGTITLATACTGTLTITRVTPRTQPTSYRTQGTLDLGALETGLDRIEMQMQESVVQGGVANLASLAITTPLPLASGGTGTSALTTSCGSGVVTSDGTQLLCTALVGLAPPGTGGVLLQSVTPGTSQTGHININGTIAVGGTSTTVGGRISSLGSGVLFASPAPGAVNGFVFNTSGGMQVSAPSLTIQNSNSSFVSFIPPQSGSPALISVLSNNAGSGIASGAGGGSLWIQGSGNSGSNPNVIIDTQGTSLLTGPLLDVRLAAVSKMSVSKTGVVTNTGVTSSGPISGTTGTFTGGATIGTSGTAITGSFRGTKSWTPGTLPACNVNGCNASVASTAITVTGAAAGADCIAGVVPPETITGVSVQCIVSANSCQVAIENQSAFSPTFGAATYYCRVFNP